MSSSLVNIQFKTNQFYDGLRQSYRVSAAGAQNIVSMGLGEKHTNVGSWEVPPNKYVNFLETYSSFVFDEGCHITISEVHASDAPEPLYLDLDFTLKQTRGEGGIILVKNAPTTGDEYEEEGEEQAHGGQGVGAQEGHPEGVGHIVGRLDRHGDDHRDGQLEDRLLRVAQEGLHSPSPRIGELVLAGVSTLFRLTSHGLGYR